jgi:WD domain, G-beta repeat
MNIPGMYVAVCAFDRTVSLFDFFSGELLCQVSGHSEIITAVRFSPDGRYLLSVGGDGCIMKWSLGEHLVEGIQERLLELTTAHKLKMARIPAPVPAHSDSRRDSGAKGVPGIMPPLPPPPVRGDRETFPPAPRASSSSSSSLGGGVRAGAARDLTREKEREREQERDPVETSRLEEEDNRVFRVAPKGKESKIQGLGHIAEETEGEDESDMDIVDSLDGERDDATEKANRQLDGLESWLEELVSLSLSISLCLPLCLS